jgi:hypothetical protein
LRNEERYGLYCWSDQLKDDEMAGAVTAVEDVMTQCPSCQEQEACMRDYLVQKLRSAVETRGAVFGIKMQNDVVTLLCVTCYFIRSYCTGMFTAVSRCVTALLQSYLCGDS